MDTNNVNRVSFLLAHGQKDTKKHSGADYDTITFNEIWRLCKQPQCKPKGEADFIIPSTYHKSDGRSHEAQRQNGWFHMLCVDVDDGNPSKDEVTQAVANVVGNVALLIYSSAGSTPENRKWRVLIPLKRPLAGVDYPEYQDRLFDGLALEGIKADHALSRAGQPIFLPNVPDDKRDDNGNPFFYEYGAHSADRLDLLDHPLTKAVHLYRQEAEKAALQAKLESQRKAELRAQRKAEMPDDVDPIDEFNARHSIESLLIKYGYERLGGSNQWHSPNQSTPTYPVRDFGDYWVSMSGSDYAAGIGYQCESGKEKHKFSWGDAFDLFKFYDHNNDETAAVRAYGREINPLGVKMDYVDFPTYDVPATQPKQDVSQDDTSDADDDAQPPAEMGEIGRLPLITKSNGAPMFNVFNVLTVMREHPQWKDVFAYDDFAQRKMVLKRIPSTAGKFSPREIRDSDYTDVVSWFNRNGFPSATKTTICDCVDAICNENIISPVKHWLLDLVESKEVTEQDDLLLDCWLILFMGVQPKDDRERRYVYAVARKWLISAVARAINAGCKADGVLILEGRQGAGKSTALRILAGDEWFGDALPHMGTKDASDYLRGKWIVELAELSNVNKAEVEIVKAFVSRTEERFRPAYGRSEITYPRHCVFAGTTNKSDYLRDETGNRRFWPVKCGEIDLEGLRENRDTLLRAAVKAYQDGEKWWLEGEAEEIAREQQESRLSVDEWHGIIEAHVGGMKHVSITDIATVALGLEKARIGRMEQNRISAILTQLGYVRNGRFTGGEFKSQSRFTRDDLMRDETIEF